MDRRKIYFYTALIVVLATIALLLTGSPVLTVALDKGKKIPLGTFITWAGMIAFPLTVYWGIKELRKPTNRLNTLLAHFLKVIIVLGILWVPISYLLSGNLSFSFSEKESFQGGQVAMRWFWYLSYGIGIGTLAVLTVYWISLFFNKTRTGFYFSL